jgi:ethanolamine ammonia-lyase large subunit
MGVDVCYTNHAEADQNDMDLLAFALANAGVNFVIAVPGADDIMLNYQSLSFHDIVRLRHVFLNWDQPQNLKNGLGGWDCSIREAVCPQRLHRQPRNF